MQWRGFAKNWKLPEISVNTLILVSALLLVVFYNNRFWKTFVSAFPTITFSDYVFTAGIFLFLIALFSFLLALVGFKWLIKPVLVSVFLVASVSSYFMDTYSTVISKNIIASIFETDAIEAAELRSWHLYMHMLFFGLLPAYLVLRVPMWYQKFSKELLERVLLVLVCIGVGMAILAPSYKALVMTIRENKLVRVFVNPVHPLVSLISYFRQSVKSVGQKIQPIGTQPTRSAASKMHKKGRWLFLCLARRRDALIFH